MTHGENRKIIEEINCQHINSQLIVNLIRLKKTLTRSESFSTNRNPPVQKQDDDINRQIDISVPSLKFAPQIDMEIIEMLLNVKDIRIERKINETENEYFRRGAVQLEQINGRN